MTTPVALKQLYGQLTAVGISRGFAKKVLPSWWDDEIAKRPAGLQQAQLLFCRAFNIDLGSLNGAHATFRSVERKFKLHKNVQEQEVSASAHFATAIARLVLTATPPTGNATPSDPCALRSAVLGRRPCVDLEGLLDASWNLGIPVVHVNEFPGKKMTGLAVRVDDRYAVVLGHSKHPAFMLFNVAHELGHIGCGHLHREGFIADEKIERSDSDSDEAQANRYATIVLNGEEMRYVARSGHLTAINLCQSAQRVGAKDRVDAGHIILNYAHSAGGNTATYATANAALKLLGGEAKGDAVINAVMNRRLDWSMLSEDQAELLRTATGIAES